VRDRERASGKRVVRASARTTDEHHKAGRFRPDGSPLGKKKAREDREENQQLCGELKNEEQEQKLGCEQRSPALDLDQSRADAA
jgi:hypothetical protein